MSSIKTVRIEKLPRMIEVDFEVLKKTFPNIKRVELVDLKVQNFKNLQIPASFS